MGFTNPYALDGYVYVPDDVQLEFHHECARSDVASTGGPLYRLTGDLHLRHGALPACAVPACDRGRVCGTE